MLVDDLLGRIAEEEAQQYEAQQDADGLGGDGEEDAPEDAEDQRVGCREDDGGREAQRVDEERQEEAEDDGPFAEGGDVGGCLLDVAACEQPAEVRQEGRVCQVDDEEEQDDGQCSSHLDHAHGFFHMVIPPRVNLAGVCLFIIASIRWRLPESHRLFAGVPVHRWRFLGFYDKIENI